MEAGTATTIEELRARLGDLEARQRAAGGVADEAWALWSQPDAGSVTAGRADAQSSATEGHTEGRTEQVGADAVRIEGDGGGEGVGAGGGAVVAEPGRGRADDPVLAGAAVLLPQGRAVRHGRDAGPDPAGPGGAGPVRVARVAGVAGPVRVARVAGPDVP